MAATISGLLAETGRLEKRLRKLVKQHPEDGFEPDERILNRILTNDWRHAVGGIHGPLGERYWETVAWVDSFDAYTKRLTELCARQPERLSTLPLTQRLRLSAAELLRLLKLQRETLNQWAEAVEASEPQGRSKNERKFHKRIEQFADDLGLDALAAQIGCSRDTLSDFLSGKTKPQEKTMKKLRAYAQSR